VIDHRFKCLERGYIVHGRAPRMLTAPQLLGLGGAVVPIATSLSRLT
jgi:hypothetical protein